MSVSSSVLWFRLDLRLADNLALQAAIQRGGAVIPVFIHAPDEEAPWPPGGASRWWLHRPWQAPAEVLARAGVELARTYPRPMVSHAIAREVALEAFSRIRAGKHG